jgi:hypothetical protein
MIYLFRKNLKIKIIAVVVAVIVWFYIMGELGYPTLFSNKKECVAERVIKKIPVYIMQNSSGFKGNVVVSPTLIDIVIKGKEEHVKTLKKEDILSYVDVSDFGSGIYFSVIKVIIPPEVELSGEIKKAKVEVGVKWEKKLDVINNFETKI